MKSLYQFRLLDELKASDTQVRISQLIGRRNEDSSLRDVEFQKETVVLQNGDGSVFEMAFASASGGMLTFHKRGLDENNPPVEKEYNKKTWGNGTKCYVTAGAGDFIDKDEDQVWNGEQTFTGGVVIQKNLKAEGQIDAKRGVKNPTFATKEEASSFFSDSEKVEGLLVNIKGNTYRWNSITKSWEMLGLADINQEKVQENSTKISTLEEKLSTAEGQIQGIQTSIQEMGAVKGLSFKAIPNSEIVKEKKILIASSLIRGNADIYSYVSPYILQINFGKSLHKIKEVKSDKFYFSFPVEGMVDEEVNFTFKLSSGYIGDQIIHTETRNFKIKNKIRNEIIFEVPRNIIEHIEASVTDCVAVISCPQNKVLVHIFGSYNRDGFGNMGINDSYYDKSFEFYIYAQFTLPFNCLGIGKYGLEETYKNFIGITLGETKGHKIDKVEGDVLLEGKIIARKISTTKKETIKGCRFRATSNSGSGKFSIYGADENGNIQLTNKIFEKDFVCSAFGKQVVNGSNTFHNYQIPDGFEFIAKKDGYIRFGGLGIRHDGQFYIRLLINDNVVRTLNYPRATNKEQSFDYFVKKGEKVKMQVYGYFDKLYLYSLDQETSIAFKLNLDANKTYYLLLEGIDSCFGMKEFDAKFTSENPELASIRNIPHGDFVLKKGNLNEKILVYSSIVHHISVSNNVDDQPFYLENNVEQLFIKLYRNHNERLLKIVPKQVYLSQSSSLSTIQLGEGIVDIGLIYESGDPVEILVNGGIVELSEVNLIPGKKYCLHKGLLLTEDEIIQKNYRHYGIFGIAITEHLLFMNYVPTNTDIKTGNIPLGMPMGYATIGGHVVPIYG